MSDIVQKQFELPSDLKFVFDILATASKHLKVPPEAEIAVYGGYVRDKLRDEPFEDMDISVPCLNVAIEFIKILEQ